MGGRQSGSGHRSGFTVLVDKRAEKALARLPGLDRDRIAAAIDGLGNDPLPEGCEPVRTAEKGTSRIRAGNYRMIYVLFSDEQVIIVAKIGDVQVINAHVGASGGSHATANPSGRLDAVAKGGSHVRHVGSPTLGTIDKDSSSSVKQE